MRVPTVSQWRRPLSRVGEGAIWLTWLVRLRWLAVVAQLVTVALVSGMFDALWTVPVLLSADAVLIIANLLAMRRLTAMDTSVGPRVLLAQLGLDIVVLTTFLMLSGGQSNPFSVLYLVHVAMAAVMLPARYASALTAVVIGAYGALHFSVWPLHLERHLLGPDVLAIGGSLTALTIAAVTVSYFVVGLASTLRWREKMLLDAQERTSRTDRLRSVGTMAAGAAHELNTPLSTVGLRLRRIARRHQDDDTVADLHAIRTQLDRCEEIVQQLLVGAGDPSASHLMVAPLADFVDDAVSMWTHGNGVDVMVVDGSGGVQVELPRTAFIQGLVNLLENAREAQDDAGATEAIEVELTSEGDMAVVIVRDHGVGLPEQPDRVGEPFFTTKDTGTGLGVFVARAVADGSGGGLRYVSRPGLTEARWWFSTAFRRNP